MAEWYGTPDRRTRRRTAMRRATMLLIAVVLAGASACSNSSSKKNAAMRPSAVGDSTANGAVTAPSKAGSRIDLTQAQRPRQEVIHTAEVALQAKDVDGALRKATEVVAQAGGALFSSEAALGDPDSRHVQAVFKVPPEQFDRVMRALASVGRVTSSRTSTEDVTGQVVDLDARLAAARTGVARLRELLAKSGNVPDLLQVEHALAQREADAESLAGQLAALRSRVDQATITVDVSPAPVAAKATPSHHIPGFLAGLRTGVAAFVNTVLVGATGLGFALPFLVVLALFGIPALRIARRRRTAAVSQ